MMISSILVNPSAITALQNLRQTQQNLENIQRQASTGLKISEASDGPATWAIAVAMKSDRNVVSVIHDSLQGANSLLNVAQAAMKSAIGVMNEVKDNLAQAQQPGADKAKILSTLQQYGEQLESIVASATFTGINALDGSYAGPLKFISSYNGGSGSADSTIGTIDLTLQTLIDGAGGGTGILEAAQGGTAAAATNFTNMTAVDLSAAKIADTFTNADKALADLMTFAARIGSTQTRVQQQSEFTKLMTDALSTGVSSLVDADMNDVSTRLQALQTQQQLGVQSLSIANQNAQMIMKLFQ